MQDTGHFTVTLFLLFLRDFHNVRASVRWGEVVAAREIDEESLVGNESIDVRPNAVAVPQFLGLDRRVITNGVRNYIGAFVVTTGDDSCVELAVEEVCAVAGQEN